MNRRNFLKAGVLGFAGMSFADLLRAEDAAGIRSSQREERTTASLPITSP